MIILLALIVTTLSFLIVLPMLTPILSAGILAYLFLPVYLKLLSFWTVKHQSVGKKVSALIIVILVIVALLIPLGIFIMLLMMNARLIASSMRSFGPMATVLFDLVKPYFHSPLIDKFNIDINLPKIFSSIAGQLFNVLQGLFSQIPNFLFSAFATLFIMYYLLTNSQKVIATLGDWFPIPQDLRVQSMKRFNQLSRGLIITQIIIAASQSILMAIACFILGLPHKVLIVMFTFVASCVPFIGAFVVWVTISVYLLFGYLQGTGQLWQPIFMVIYGTLLVSLIDNIIRPLILSGSSEINPAIVFVGLLGGFVLLGIPGIFLGPMILTFTELSLDVLRRTLTKTELKEVSPNQSQ